MHFLDPFLNIGTKLGGGINKIRKNNCPIYLMDTLLDIKIVRTNGSVTHVLLIFTLYYFSIVIFIFDSKI